MAPQAQQAPSPGTTSSFTLSDGTQLDPKVVKVMRAIRQVETGGDYNAVGDNGDSHGAFQWNKGNFAKQAHALGLDPNDFSPANQNKVAYAQIKSMKDQGLQPDEIAARWNGAKVDSSTGRFTYINPAYGDKFRQALGEQTGMQGSPISQSAVNLGQEASQKGGLGDQLMGRVNDFSHAISDAASGKQAAPLISAPLQAAGAIAGGVGDIANAALKLIPGVSQVENAVGQGAAKVAQTGVGQQFLRGVNKFQEEHPELSKDLGAGFNIATLLPIGKGLGIAGKAASEAIPAGTRALAESGGIVGQVAKKRLFSEALDVVSPKVTPSVAKAAIKGGRGTISGLAKTEGIAPDLATQRAAEASMGIVRRGATAVENANAIRGEIGNVATKLQKDLTTMDITPIVTQEDMVGLMRNAMAKIGENPVLVGDAEESANRILKKFQSYLPTKGDITASDILGARKQLDSWMESQTGGSHVFDPKFENAKTIALRAVRQEANGLIAAKAPTVAVKGMLARQSALYDALDNVAAKGTKEIGTGRLKRFGQRHPQIRGLVKLGAGLAGYEEIKQHAPFLPLP